MHLIPPPLFLAPELHPGRDNGPGPGTRLGE